MDALGKGCLGLREWYSPANITKVQADLIAVHGLNANPYWTWAAVPEGQKKKHQSWLTKVSRSLVSTSISVQETPGPPPCRSEVIWLEKLLPNVIPNARIMAFGYQSNYLRAAPKRDIGNCAQELLNALVRNRVTDEERQRPIVFLGHCFGGIVIKEALVKATLASKAYGSIRSSTRGIIFLGTPHNGTSVAAYGDMLVSITKAAGLGSDTRLIRTLREQSPELLKLTSNFSDIYDNFDVYCFYELLPTHFGNVVVNQQSATIEGRPSEGLNTDHSGLNKFGSEDDYDFRRVAREIKKMVEEASSRMQGEQELQKAHFDSVISNTASPWEDASELVSLVYESFHQATVTATVHNQTPAMDILRCRFGAWAYLVGLATIGQSRRPLHGVLDTLVAPEICDCLRRILHNLPEISKDTKKSSTHFEGVRKLIDALYRTLSEDDRTTLDQVFSATVLRSDDASALESIETGATLRAFPDIEVMAAMKRINILRDRAEATRPEHEKLSIDMDKISLDKPRSARSTGLYKGQSSEVVDIKPILVEWKQYEGYWDTEIGNQLFNRAELLTYFLRKASQGSSIIDQRILNCLGYCHDEKQKRLGFVFANPSSDKSHSYMTLHSWITQYARKPALLGDRFRLAQTLCKAMFGFHRARWFHKSFSSYNVLFFPDTNAVIEDDESELSESTAKPPVSDYSLIAPYIVGFNNSRPDRPTEFSEPARPSLDVLRYRHWEYKNAPMQKYKREYDYYSLGMVLLEIGLWFPLSALMQKHAEWYKLDAKAFADGVRNDYCPNLGSYVGAVYQGIVEELLDCDLCDGRREGLGEETDVEFMQTVEFQASILERLGRCNA